MKDFIKYVELDVHKETIAVSVAPGDSGELRYEGEIANTPQALKKRVRQLGQGGTWLSFCYDAGRCGRLAVPEEAVQRQIHHGRREQVDLVRDKPRPSGWGRIARTA